MVELSLDEFHNMIFMLIKSELDVLGYELCLQIFGVKMF